MTTYKCPVLTGRGKGKWTKENPDEHTVDPCPWFIEVAPPQRIDDMALLMLLGADPNRSYSISNFNQVDLDIREHMTTHDVREWLLTVRELLTMNARQKKMIEELQKELDEPRAMEPTPVADSPQPEMGTGRTRKARGTAGMASPTDIPDFDITDLD